jgi:hypothetical protein
VKHREPPSRIHAGRLPRRLQYDPQVRKWCKRLQGDPDAKPTDVSDEQLAFLTCEMLKRRGEEFDATLYEQAVADLTPVVSAPLIEDPLGDLRHVFAQRAMQNMWRECAIRGGKRGPTPNWPGALAVLCLLAMTGRSTHINDSHDDLSQRPELQKLFARVHHAAMSEPAHEEHATAGASGSAGVAVDVVDFSAPGYSSALRIADQLAPKVSEAAMKANIEMAKELRKLIPQTGKRLMIDGASIPAWVVQASAGTSPNSEAREERFRKQAPDAGFRAYYRSKEGKRPIKPGDKLKNGLYNGRGKAWRGYSLVVISCQATGIPLVWTVIPANEDEAAAIVPLLSRLYELWPDIDAEVIGGDSAWDEDPWTRLCEVDYGLHPIFRLHDPRGRGLEAGESREGSVGSIDGAGRLLCAKHQKPLEFVGFDSPRRDDLRPGQSSSEGAFRIRAVCRHAPHPCGNVGLRALCDWSSLTYFPHYRTGSPQRHAYRLAYLTRLNGIEQLNNRYKAGLKLGTSGPDRNRIRDLRRHEAVISLGLTSLTAYMLTDQNIQAGNEQRLPRLPRLPIDVDAPDGATSLATTAPATTNGRGLASNDNGKQSPRRPSPHHRTLMTAPTPVAGGAPTIVRHSATCAAPASFVIASR